MGWVLLLLLVVAGPGPGAAATQAAGWPWVRQLRGFHRLLLQQNSTDPPPPPAASCNATSLPGCASCEGDPDFPESWRCTVCAGNLLLLRNSNGCGCATGSYSSGPDTCRDCPKGSFCAGGMYTGEDNVPPAIPCSIYGSGLTTVGVRTTRKEGCVNLPGYAFTTIGLSGDPGALPCPADTYQVGLRKQRGCVPCPAGLTTFNRTMQTSLGACDIDACVDAPCGKNMDCVDLPRPAEGGPEGRECRCVPGATFVSDLLGCYDPAETSMIGGPTDVQPARVLTSFETRCPRGTIIVAISGTANSQLQSIGPLTCSDGSSTGPLPVGFGLQSLDGKFTTRISPDGFTGMTVTAEYSVKSVSFYRQDQAFSATYGTMADVTTQFGRRQFLTCPNFGVAIGLVGIKAVQTGVPVMLGLICSNLPCPVRTDTIFGPPGAPQIPSSPGSYLGNSPEPVQTTTATQCCSICTRDFRCEYWVRDDRSGSCWRVYREPFQAGAPLPGDWTYQAAPGFSAGPTTPKTSGISVSGTYIGCYQDTGCNPSSRLKAALSLNNPRLTVKQCLDLALVAGWPYAGLAPGATPGTTSCFAGDKLPTATAKPGCFAACSGNVTERCGDTNCQLSIYSVLKPRWPLQLIDTGMPTRGFGWYDVQCQGAVNDYCRWTNTGSDSSSYWSCALAGWELPNTLPLQIPEQYAISTACQEAGYRAQALSGLNCGDLALPWENGCQTRQCCKAKCDANPLCTGFVFGNSEANNCRSNGDGQNCCWLKGGECRSVFNALTASYVRAQAAVCLGYPPDPADGIMFCPDNGSVGSWPQGTTCRAECKYGIQGSDMKPFSVCQSNGQWSDVVGICKPPCDLPPLLCPESWSAGNVTASGNSTLAAAAGNGTRV